MVRHHAGTFKCHVHACACAHSRGLFSPLHGMLSLLGFPSLSLSATQGRQRAFSQVATLQDPGACSIAVCVSGSRAPRPILAPPYRPLFKLVLTEKFNPKRKPSSRSRTACVGINNSQKTAQRLSASPSETRSSTHYGGAGVDGGFVAGRSRCSAHSRRADPHTQRIARAWMRPRTQSSHGTFRSLMFP